MTKKNYFVFYEGYDKNMTMILRGSTIVTTANQLTNQNQQELWDSMLVSVQSIHKEVVSIVITSLNKI